MNRSKVGDIKVLGKDDVLVILAPEADSKTLDTILTQIEEARKSNKKNIALGGDFRVYILRDGAKMLLKDELNKLDVGGL